MTANWHVFTNNLLAHIYKFIACKLHDSLFVSVTKRKLCECCRTAVQCVAKFRVLPSELLFVFSNFFSLTKLWRKIALCSSELLLDMPWNFTWTANFRQKVAGRKNEIRAFRLRYFWTILYTVKYCCFLQNSLWLDRDRGFLMNWDSTSLFCSV